MGSSWRRETTTLSTSRRTLTSPTLITSMTLSQRPGRATTWQTSLTQTSWKSWRSLRLRRKLGRGQAFMTQKNRKWTRLMRRSRTWRQRSGKKGEMKADQWIDQTKKSTLTRNSTAKKRERSVAKLKAEFETLGVTGLAEKDEDAHFNRARSASKGPKSKRAKLDGVDPHATKGSVARSKSGIRGEDAAKLAILKKKRDVKTFANVGKAGESDRRILEKKPKHLYSGKRGMGKTDRR